MLTSQQLAAKEEAHQMFDERSLLRSFVAKSQPREAASCHERSRLQPGIDGIGIAGDALRVYIREEQRPIIKIPNTIGKLRTERVTTTGFHAFAPPPRQSALTPVPCGVSVGHSRISAGTLGCLVDTPVGRCILSNNHVLANANHAQFGDDIFQPGLQDHRAESPARRIAGLTDYERIEFGAAGNRIDAAIAALDEPDSAVPAIMSIGRHANPPTASFINQSVAKHGRTTGLTFGTVVDVSFDGNVTIDGSLAYFEEQIAIAGNFGPFSEWGDSGSLVLDNPGSQPVGLLFAGDDTHTLANPIQAVLNRFGATIVTA